MKKIVIVVYGKDNVGILYNISKILKDFIDRGGHIPAPIHSFKN